MAIEYGEPVSATEDQLTRLGKLANYQVSLEQTIASLEAQLKDIQEKYRRVSEIDIPGVLDETGLSEVRLADGTKIVIREDLRVSTSGKNRDVINNWLISRGHDDLIRDEVTAAFGKGHSDVAEKALEMLRGLTTSVDRKRYVNPQTFAALIRELLAGGEDVPLDQLGVFVQRRAKLEQKPK